MLAAFLILSAVARQSLTALVFASVLLPRLFQIECLLQAVGCFCLWLRLRLYRVRSSVCRDFVLGVAGCRGQTQSDRRAKHDGQCGDDWFSHLNTSLEAVVFLRVLFSLIILCIGHNPEN